MKLLLEVNEELEYLKEASNGESKGNYYISGPFMQAEAKNKNGRVYPLATLSREVTRYQNQIKEKRSMGELSHPSCFHEQTEILTVNDGWKKIKDVSLGEYIYSLNTKDNSVQEQPVLSVYNESYKGKMIKFNNRTFSTTVTPNHRFILGRGGKDEKYFLTAQELYDNKELPHTYIPKKHDYDIKPSDRTVEIGPHSFSSETFFPFMALFLSEGHCQKRKGRNRSYNIKLFQNEGPKAEIIQKLLDSLTLKFKKKYTGISNKNINRISWTCHDVYLAEFLFPLGKHYEKYLPQNLISEMTTKEANLFLEYYILGDGRGKLREKYTATDIFSTSEKMIDNVTQIAFIAGVATRKYVISEWKDYIFAGRTIKAENKRPLHFCQLLTTNGAYIDRRFMNIEEIDFDDTVHCVSVENQTFYARDNGYTFWTGNSPSINLDRVSHIITELNMVGNDAMGKAKILDTPMGKIVKNLMDEGIKLGVSSRGVGSLKQANGYQIVQEDFQLATVDVVSDPSAPQAWVQNLRESKDWIFESGIWKEADLVSAQKTLNESNRKDFERKTLELFAKFMIDL